MRGIVGLLPAARWFGCAAVVVGLLGLAQVMTIATGSVAVETLPTATSVAFCLIVMAMSFSSTVAPWGVVLLWSLADIATVVHSGVVQWVPSTCMTAVALAAGRLAYRRAWCGALAACVPTVSATLLTAGQGASLIWTVSTLLQNAAWYGAAAGVGMLLARYRALLRAERRRKTQAMREEIMIRLHDSVANDLSYAAALLQRAQTSDGEVNDAMTDAGSAVHHALERTRDAIEWLQTAEDGRSDDGDDGTATRGVSGRRDGAGSIRTVMAVGDERLSGLGFIGQSVLLCDDGDCPDDRDAAFLVPFLRELYGNIAGHADPKGGYAVSLACGPASYRVCVSDEAARRDGAGEGRRGDGKPHRHGFGLERYRRRIESVGGTFRVDRSDGVWTMLAVIPRASAGAPRGCAGRR